MTTWVVLLRAVNVGGSRKLPMADLRTTCQAAGFGDVRSHIQSGNLVLSADADAAAVEARIERAIRERFGFATDAIARSAGQWRGYVTGNPMPGPAAAAPSRVMLVLSRQPPDAGAVAGLQRHALDGEEIAAAGDALWVHFPQGAGRSRLAAALGRAGATARNWSTVLKLDAMAGG